MARKYGTNNGGEWKSKTDRFQGFVEAKLEDILTEQRDIKSAVKEYQKNSEDHYKELSNKVQSLENFRTTVKLGVATIASAITLVVNLIWVYIKDIFGKH